MCIRDSHRSKQARQIGPYPPARLNPAKTRRDLLNQRIQLTRPIDSFIHCGHDHASMAAQFITAIPAVVLVCFKWLLYRQRQATSLSESSYDGGLIVPRSSPAT